jgi:hypothetical protein
MSSVRPEFGPTLPEILGPRLRALPRGGRAAVAAAALVAVAIAAFLVLGSGGDQTAVVVRKPIAFNLVHGPGVHRVAPRDDELLRLESRDGLQLFTVRPFRLGAYRGDSSAALLAMSSPLIEAMRAQDPGFVLRSEGRARVNLLPGYQIVFQTRRDGRLEYGKRFLLVSDDPHPTEGIDVLLISSRSTAVPKADAVGSNGVLKSPLRSLRFGTERP